MLKYSVDSHRNGFALSYYDQLTFGILVALSGFVCVESDDSIRYQKFILRNEHFKALK